MNPIYLDVSDLAAPEPMIQILRALSTLSKNEYLQVSHRREPFPLYDKLIIADWFYYCHKLSEEHFHIYIYRKEEQLEFAQIISEVSR